VAKPLRRGAAPYAAFHIFAAVSVQYRTRWRLPRA
jgi:hypothetical protein